MDNQAEGVDSRRFEDNLMWGIMRCCVDGLNTIWEV